MCIIALAWQLNKEHPILLLNNRDEFFERPTMPLHQWKDTPILAGRDSQAGGTWLGFNPQTGRFATILNYREFGTKLGDISRGQLIVNYLISNVSPLQFAEEIDLDNYSGFNLLLGTLDEAVIVNNRGHVAQQLEPGLYSISNGMPEVLWPKSQRLLTLMEEKVIPVVNKPEQLIDSAFEVLSDTHQFSSKELPQTGLTIEHEKQLSSINICLPDELPNYGTRVSSVLSVKRYENNGINYQFVELDRLTGRQIEF